jgi:peptidyl-prolyl cis-trans isomerase D
MAKGSKVSRALVWILLGLLVVGLAGFGIGGFGGTARRIGTVGGQEIGVNDYARALRQALQAFSAQAGRPVPLAEAQAFGLDAQVRQRLVTTAALDDLAARIGLSVGDARLAREIRAIPTFQGLSGGFDRAGYRVTLEQNGFTEASFEARVRADLARSVLERAVAAPIQPPAVMAATLYAYAAERRNLSVLRLTEADLTAPLPEPTEADLRAHYAANPDAYTLPETRRIAYAVLLPETLVESIPTDEAALRAAYDQRIDEFVQPERRLVERLAFADAAAAEAARNRLDAGAATFDDLVAERGLTLADIDLGDVAEADLGEAGPAVFAAEAPAVVGPLPSPLGPALFRINGVLAAEEVTFEEARPELQAELALDAARRAIADRMASLEDRLAAGDTLEDLADEPGMQVGTIEVTAGTREGLAAYAAFRERAARVRESDFPELFQLEDGGVAAIRLDAVIPPALQPFEDVAATVAEDWRAARLAEAMAARAAEIASAVAAGATLGGFGIVTVHSGLARDGFVEDAPPALIAEAFRLAEGEAAVVAEGPYVAVLRVDAVIAADPAAPEAALATTLFERQIAQGMGEDAFALFARAVENAVPIRLDQGVINAVHARLQ